MNRKVKLPLALPRIRSYSKYAASTSIIATQQEMIPWIYYSYWQLIGYYYASRKHFWIDMGGAVSPFYLSEIQSIPCLICNPYEREYIKRNYKCFSEFIIERLQEQQYIYVVVNKKYIQQYNCNEDIMHDMMINGYDLDTNSLICNDYFNQFYQEKHININEIDSSFLLTNDNALNLSEFKEVYTLSLSAPKVYPVQIPIKIEKKNILQCLYYLLHPEESEIGKLVFHKEVNGAYLGLEIYEVLADKITKCEFSVKDTRPFFILKDHINIITDAIESFGLVQSAEAVVDLRKAAIRLCNLSIKIVLYIDQKRDCTKEINKICMQLNSLHILEKNLLEKTLICADYANNL